MVVVTMLRLPFDGEMAGNVSARASPGYRGTSFYIHIGQDVPWKNRLQIRPDMRVSAAAVDHDDSHQKGCPMRNSRLETA